MFLAIQQVLANPIFPPKQKIGWSFIEFLNSQTKYTPLCSFSWELRLAVNFLSKLSW